jgi:hypothetical protein
VPKHMGRKAVFSSALPPILPEYSASLSLW